MAAFSRAAVALALALATAGCPKDDAPPGGEGDRTIRKLKEEQARLDAEAKRSARKAAEPDPLAEAAVAQAPPTTLPLPPAGPVQLAGATVALKQLETMQSVRGAKAALSTADRFVRVTVSAEAPTEVRLELAGAALRSGEQRYPVARDVQRLGGTPLSLAVGPTPQDVVIFFEAPPDAIKKGLTLVLPAATGEVEVPLQ